MTWLPAPSNLYAMPKGATYPVPVLAIDPVRGVGLLPGGGITEKIYVNLPSWRPTEEPRPMYNESLAAEPCPHGEPRGPRFCALCRRSNMHTA